MSLKRLKKSGAIVLKETMAICMIDPQFVSATPFKQSHLLSKLNKLVVCARLYESRAEEHTILYSVGTFDLDDPATYAQVKADYELVQSTIKTTGFSALTGKMGVLVQPRTKGPGHGSTSRAFYARKGFVSAILGLGLSGRTA